MNKIYYNIFLIVLLLCYSSKGYTQEKFTAKIISSDHKIGLKAVFEIKMLKLSVLADSSGMVSLMVPRGQYTVSIKHLGYENIDTLLIFPNVGLQFVMKPTITNLDAVEVVSTGYQTLPKERATGSFVTISNKLLNEQVGTDLISRLEGVASSLTIDRSTNNSRSTTNGGIMIRGLSTIEGPRDPLIVLDNFPYDGKLENINPNDIESITILRDAAASSIWGAKAGNGVIVITSKKAVLGQQLKISANGSVKIANEPNLFAESKISSSDYIDVEQFLFSKGFFTSAENATNKPALTPAVELFIAARDGKISSEKLASELNVLRSQDFRQQMAQYNYSAGMFQQYNVDVKGGAQSNAWNVGVGYDKNKTELSATFSRISLKVDHQVKLNKKLSLNTRFNYTQNESVSGKAEISSVGDLPPYINIADADGNALNVMKTYRSSYTSSLAGGLLNWEYYPLTDYQFNRRTIKRNEFLLNTFGSYKVYSDLSIDLRYQYQRQQGINSLLNSVDGYFARNMINSFSQLTGGVLKRVVPYGGILSTTNDLMEANNLRGQLNYGFTKTDHQLAVILAGEFRENNLSGSSFNSYGYNEKVLTNVNVDYSTTYPNLITGVKSFINSNMGYSEGVNKYISMLGNGAYTYKQKYTLSLSARKDASNLFGVNSNDRWNPFWSAGASWLISKENFFGLKAIDHLKLRVTYGTSGNTNPKMAAVTTLSVGGASPYTQLPSASFSNYANPELRWEKVATTNIGLDFSTKIAGIRGSIEVYQKNAKDLFGDEVMDYTKGVGSTITKNTANMKAYGLDIELNASANFGAVKWNPSLFLNFYKDKVTDYFLLSQQGSNYVNGDFIISGIVGKPVHSLFSYPWAGLDPANGDPRGYFKGEVNKVYSNFTGALTSIRDLIYEGPIYAPFSGAIANTFQFKNLSVSFRMSFKFGNYLRKRTINYSDLFSFRTGHGDYAKRWQNPGDENYTTVPSFSYPLASGRDSFYAESEATVIRGDVVRFQYVNVNYTLNRRNVKWLPLSNIDVFGVANNLGLLYKGNKEGIDPEYQFTPPSRTFAFGLRTEF